MFGLDPTLGRDEPLRVVCLGAHADDVEIGAGGTLLRLLRERPRVHATVAVLSGSPERAAEASASAAAFGAGAERLDVHTLDYRDGFFPQQVREIKEWTRATLEPLHPHLVLTHRRDDAHQDHRVVGELSWQTFRGARLAEYEIPKWDGDLDRPNAYVTLDARTMDHKLALLAEHFPSQHDRAWYDAETFRGLARVRGVEAGSRYAEAFHCAKVVW